MGKQTDKKPTCSNCKSKDLGNFLCRNCYENLFVFDSDESLKLFVNEFDSLFPELDAFGHLTFQEMKQLKDEIEAEVAAKMSARLTPHQQDRFFTMHEKVQKARLSLINSENPILVSANVLGIALLSVGLMSLVFAASLSQGGLLLLIPVIAIVYFNFFVFCVKCKKFVFKKPALVRKTILEERYGSHTEHQEITTSIQNYDNRGRISGYSSASTYIPHNVEHLDETAEYVYACSYCGNIWGATSTKRFNLN
jgi:hypothetical protein